MIRMKLGQLPIKILTQNMKLNELIFDDSMENKIFVRKFKLLYE